MKINSTSKISFIVALIFAMVNGILLYISNLIKSEEFFIYLIFAVLLSFIILYITFYFTFNALIISKIKPLFKMVNSLQISVNEPYKNIDDKELLSKIEKKVVQWSKSKIDEIAILKANEKFRKEFLGNVSHELKTPLFNIQGYILTLIDGGIEDKKINIKYLERTEKNINRLISVVRDLETISKIESGEMKLTLESFDIMKIFDEIIEMQHIRAKRKNISFNFINLSKKPSLVEADKKGIFDVISNLISNSINYGKIGGRTNIKFEDINSKLRINIEDNGIGMSEKNLPRIFERFFRADKSHSNLQGGTGLGLSIVKHMIDAHNQTITVKSKLGKGSSFTFTLNKAIN